MNIPRILKIVLILEIALLLGNAAAVSRDSQDSWILEGLEVPFAIFMLTYLAYFSAEKNLNWLLVFAMVFGATVLLLPNLKYQWFQGMYTDQHHHYRLAQDIRDLGHVRTGDLYSGTPLMHISFVLHSIITSLAVIHSFKYFPILTWLVFPIVTYVVVKTIYAENPSVQKYVLFLSSIPAKPTISYIVIGTLFGPLLTFLVLSQLTKMTHKNDRRYLIILAIYSLALAATHSFTSIAFSMLLFVAYFLSQALRRIRNLSDSAYAKPSFTTLMIIMTIGIAWFSQISTTFDVSLRTLTRHLLIVEEGAPRFLYPRFFEIGFLDGLRVILVFHGADVLLILLTLIGFVLTYKKNRMFLSWYIVSLALFFVFGYAFDIGLGWYDRTIRLLLVFAPIFAGLCLYYFETKAKKIVPGLIIGSLLVLSTAQLYNCQPLIPAASSFSIDLPDDEPLVYVNQVNTVYQRLMIAHTERFVPPDAKIASDAITQAQMLGLTSISFYDTHTEYYPLSNKEPSEFDYFLIHLPGKGGGFSEQAERRTMSLILSAIYNSSYNTVYTNGESYILNALPEK